MDLVKYAKPLLSASAEDIKSTDGRVNFLILGKGGVGHDAPELTDTILIVSVSLSTENPRISLLSLPRDIWVEELKTKLNSIYYWGNKKSTNGGPDLAKKAVTDIAGLPIHYYLVFDFSSFTKVIDAVGGIDVEVENSFTDKRYPIRGKENDTCGGDRTFACRYEVITFTKGTTKMDGELALKFVRSRYSEGDEGTDLAREKRQQRVIAALKTKVSSKDVYSDPDKIQNLISILTKSIETDLGEKDFGIIAFIADAKDNIKNLSIPEGFLINPPIGKKYDNQYVFIPRDLKLGWSELQEWIKKEL